MGNLEKIASIIKEANEKEVIVKDLEVFGYQYNYGARVIGSVNKYWFGKHEVKEFICPLNSESKNENRPGTYTLALDAKKKGLNTLLIEQSSLGGTCLNFGCIPTKAYYASSELILKLKESEKLGISSSFAFDFSKIKERKDSVVSALKDGIKFSLDKAGVTIINGSGKLNKNREVIVNDEAYTAKNIVIATGSKEAVIPIKGYENCVTSTDILNLETLTTSLTIIGGGVIGVEVASIFRIQFLYGSSLTSSGLSITSSLTSNTFPLKGALRSLAALTLSIAPHSLNWFTSSPTNPST